MNIQPSKKYGFSPEEVEKRALQRFRTVYNVHRLEKTDKLNERQYRYNKKKYNRKRKTLRENLSIGEKVYVLAERIKKKKASGKIYKQTVQNISYFNKDTVFTIRRKTNYRQYKISLGKKPTSRVKQTFPKIRTFCFKIKFLVNFFCLLSLLRSN